MDLRIRQLERRHQADPDDLPTAQSLIAAYQRLLNRPIEPADEPLQTPKQVARKRFSWKSCKHHVSVDDETIDKWAREMLTNLLQEDHPHWGRHANCNYAEHLSASIQSGDTLVQAIAHRLLPGIELRGTKPNVWYVSFAVAKMVKAIWGKELMARKQEQKILA